MTIHGRRNRLLHSLCMLALLGSFVVTGRAEAQAANSTSQVGTSERSTAGNLVPEKREEEKDENEGFRHSASVQKIGRLVGMSPEQAATAFTILNFLVLLGGVGYLCAKTLPKAFRDRSSGIQKGLVDARTVTEEANARLKLVEARLSKLDDEIAGMRKQAEADAVREDARLKISMEQETAKVLAAAETEIQAATSAARRELQRHAAELAIDQATRRLEISAETDRLLIESFAQRLVGEKGGQN